MERLEGGRELGPGPALLCMLDHLGEKAAGAKMQPVGSQAQGGGAPRQTSNRRTQGKSGNHGLAIPEFYLRRCRPPAWLGCFCPCDLLRKLIREPILDSENDRKTV